MTETSYEREEKRKLKLIIGGVIAFLLIVLFIAMNPFVFVTAGQRGVVMNWGAVSDTVLGEGVHWRTPIVQSVKTIDVRTQKEQVDSSAASKDMQTVSAKVALNYHVMPEKVNLLWQKIGADYKDRIIDPAVQEAVKSTTAKYTAEELITKRESVKEEIKTALMTRLSNEYIAVDEFSIVDFNFSESFNKAIEAKQTAVQQALQAENDLRRIKVEAEQTVATARASAEAIKIQAEAINSTGGADYVALQWVDAWKSGGARVPEFITSEQSGGFIMNLPNKK